MWLYHKTFAVDFHLIKTLDGFSPMSAVMPPYAADVEVRYSWARGFPIRQLTRGERQTPKACDEVSFLSYHNAVELSHLQASGVASC